MPGLKDAISTHADYSTEFALHRTITASDTVNVPVGITQEIDFTRSITATRNRISLVLKRTVGAGGLRIKLYMKQAAGSLVGTWLLVSDSGSYLNPLELHVFSDLYAGLYRIAATIENGGATFEVHESHNSFKTTLER